MFGVAHPVVWLIGVLGLGIILFLLRERFDAEAREPRRQDRSHSPVISRKHRPTVKLVVNVDDPNEISGTESGEAWNGPLQANEDHRLTTNRQQPGALHLEANAKPNLQRATCEA